MIEIGIVVPLYKKGLQDSETIQSLGNLSESVRISIALILWDNSPTPINPLGLKELQNRFGKQIVYRHTPQNISLAKIYNEAIGMCYGCDAFIIFDQDSTLNEEYFQTAWLAFKENPLINLFLPMVKINDTIVSPGDFYLVKGKYWTYERFGKVQTRNRAAIASGMLLRMSWLKASKVKFNESLRLYNVDTDFMFKFAAENDYFFVLPYKLVHDLSNFQEEPIEKVLMRFRDFRRSIIVMSYGRGIGYFLLALLYSVYLSFKKTVAHWSVKFLF